MKRVRILKLRSLFPNLKEHSNSTRVHCDLIVRHLSIGCRIMHQNYFSNEFQPKKKIIFDGIVQSQYPDIEAINSDYTLDKFIWEPMDNWPNHVAVECGLTGKKYTFSELRRSSKKFATALQKRGYRPGQVLSIMLSNSPDYVIVVMGAIEAGMIISPINPVYTPFELSYQLYDSRAVAVVTQPNLITKLNAATELINTSHKTDYKIDIVVTNTNGISIQPGVLNFDEMVSNQIDESDLKPIYHSSDNVALLPYSSGTTGLSKGVQLTHKNLIYNFNQMENPDSFHFYPTTNDHQDVIPAILPYFHIYGLALILLRALRKGIKMVTLPKFEAGHFFSMLKNHRATILYAVPPIIFLLGRHPELTDEHMASLRLIVSGAGPIDSTDAEKVLNRFKSNFVMIQVYGMTEASPLVLIGSQNESDYSSVGKPIRSTYIKIIKSDGSTAPPGEQGEICIKGPQIMSGYLNRSDTTKEVIDNEQFYHSGDIGYYDEHGKFYIVDRLKELIKVKGFQVPPAELEAHLRCHSEVEDVAVIGIPDDRTGEKPMAFVVTKNKNAVKERELIEFVSSKVAPYKQIAKVEFVDDIPKNPSGKILRRILRDKFISSTK